MQYAVVYHSTAQLSSEPRLSLTALCCALQLPLTTSRRKTVADCDFFSLSLNTPTTSLALHEQSIK
jgi:hypothetical protein